MIERFFKMSWSDIGKKVVRRFERIDDSLSQTIALGMGRVAEKMERVAEKMEHIEDVLPNGFTSTERNIRISYDQAFCHFEQRPLGRHFLQLQKVCAYDVEGAFYSKAYQNRHWDGKKYLLGKSGSFPTGLLKKVEDWLRNKGYVVTSRAVSVAAPIRKYTGRKVAISKARPYQLEALRAFINARRGILQVATGGGKTLIAAMVINELQTPTLFMVHTKDLLWQAVAMLGDALDQKIGVIGDGKFDIQPVTVVMIQALAEAYHFKYATLDDEDEDDVLLGKHVDLIPERLKAINSAVADARLLIMDEVHRVAAPTCLETMSRISNAQWRLGLSASPWRDDGADLAIEAAFGPVCYQVSATTLIEKGFLVPPVIRFHPLRHVAWMEGERYSDYYKRAVTENDERNGKIAELAIRAARADRTVLILVRYISHGRRILDTIKKSYPSVAFLKGEDATGYRIEVLESLRQKKLMILVATTLADEGLDVPSLGTIILAGSGKSSTKALQRVGRVLRKVPGKTTGEVHDFLDTGKWLKTHVHRRREIYMLEPGFVLC